MEGWPSYNGDGNFENECFKIGENGANDRDDNESWAISKDSKENPLMVLFMMSLMTIPTEHTSGKIEFDDGDHWDGDDDVAAALEKAGNEIGCAFWKGSLASEKNWNQATDEWNNAVYTDRSGNVVTDWSKFEGYKDSGCHWLACEISQNEYPYKGYCRSDAECKGERTCNLAAFKCEGEKNCGEEDVFRNCDIVESVSCFWDWDCQGDRSCVNNSCTGKSNCAKEDPSCDIVEDYHC